MPIRGINATTGGWILVRPSGLDSSLATGRLGISAASYHLCFNEGEFVGKAFMTFNRTYYSPQESGDKTALSSRSDTALSMPNEASLVPEVSGSADLAPTNASLATVPTSAGLNAGLAAAPVSAELIANGTEAAAMTNAEALDLILAGMAQAAVTQRDKGTRFEVLALDYFRHEPTYCNLFTKVETYSEWAKRHQHLIPKPSLNDIGIDLVATNAPLSLNSTKTSTTATSTTVASANPVNKPFTEDAYINLPNIDTIKSIRGRGGGGMFFKLITRYNKPRRCS